jgi:hypothetical protein
VRFTISDRSATAIIEPIHATVVLTYDHREELG